MSVIMTTTTKYYLYGYCVKRHNNRAAGLARKRTCKRIGALRALSIVNSKTLELSIPEKNNEKKVKEIALHH